jgi:hypothetical protein
MSIKAIDLIFLEVDMSDSGTNSCGACDIAKSRLDAALELARPILGDAGYEVRVNHITVTNEEQARELNFLGSPTLRVAGSEVAPLHVSDSEKRLWLWGEKEFSEPPVGLFLDLILQGVRSPKSPAENQPREIPDYIRNYLRPVKPLKAATCDSCS